MLLLAPAADHTARAAVVLPTGGNDWNADARSFRGQNGTRVEFLCPADGAPSTVWGSDVYTDDSSVCTAAVHAGKIAAADGGTVTIEIRPGQASYTASTRNGIASQPYGQWSGSFVVLSAVRGAGTAGVKVGGAGWTTNAATHRGHNGSRYLYVCPANGTTQTRVWGTNVYTDDSSVCSAAVHIGLVTVAAGGNVTLEIRPGQSSYAGSTHNGVTTSAYGAWTGSFTFPGATPLPVPGGGGGGGGGGTTTTTPAGTAAAPPTATTTGTVTVNGRPFTTGTIPFGATVDVTRGSVALTSNVGTLKVTGAGGVTAAFVLARGTDRGKAVVELRLAKGDFGVCRKGRGARVQATTVRQLWGDGKGSFRTKGRYASATVRGTKWLTADRCDGTFVRVQRGVIGVNDFPNRRQVTVRAGRTYLARP